VLFRSGEGLAEDVGAFEAAMLAGVGGLIGIALGAIAAAAVKGALNFPARLTPALLSAGLVLAVIVGMLAGYFPARRAAGLVVVDALRDET